MLPETQNDDTNIASSPFKPAVFMYGLVVVAFECIATVYVTIRFNNWGTTLFMLMLACWLFLSMLAYKHCTTKKRS
jgi:hypothetical protein